MEINPAVAADLTLIDGRKAFVSEFVGWVATSGSYPTVFAPDMRDSVRPRTFSRTYLEQRLLQQSEWLNALASAFFDFCIYRDIEDPFEHLLGADPTDARY